MVDIVCVGNSHLNAVRAAAELRARKGTLDFSFVGFQLLDEKYQPDLVVRDGEHIFNPRFDDEFQRCVRQSGPTMIFTYLGGAEHALLALARSVRPFDLVDPSLPYDLIDLESELIPYDVMFAVCCERISFMPPWFRHLRDLAALPICQIGLPPPIAGDEHILRRAGPISRERLEQHGVAPARLRHKVWRLCLAATRHVCDENAVSLIDPPLVAVDADGCLRVQYRGQDEVHANAAYGDLLLDRMLEIATDRQRGVQ